MQTPSAYFTRLDKNQSHQSNGGNFKQREEKEAADCHEDCGRHFGHLLNGTFMGIDARKGFLTCAKIAQANRSGTAMVSSTKNHYEPKGRRAVVSLSYLVLLN